MVIGDVETDTAEFCTKTTTSGRLHKISGVQVRHNPSNLLVFVECCDTELHKAVSTAKKLLIDHTAQLNLDL